MRRPFGVSLITLLVIAWTSYVTYQAVTHRAGRMAHRQLLLCVALSVLALVAAEALWMLRSHAFAAFTLWSLCAVASLVVSRLPLASSGHGIRLMGPIVTAGLAYAIAALYLRRVV